MKKKARKIVVCVMGVMSIFAVCSTAFAEGETLNHSGTAKNSSYTTDSVPQRNDQHLVLNSHTKNPTAATVQVVAVWKNNGVWQEVSPRANFGYPCTLVISKYTVGSGSRPVHLQLKNLGNYVGVSVKTSGNWTLKK